MEYEAANFSGANELQEQQEVKEMLDQLADADPVLKDRLFDPEKTRIAIVKTGQLGLVDILIRAQYIILAFTLLTPKEIEEMDAAIQDQQDAYGKPIRPDVAFKDHMGLKYWQNTGKTFSEITLRK